MFETIMLLSFLICPLLSFLPKEPTPQQKQQQSRRINHKPKKSARKTRKPNCNMQIGLQNSQAVHRDLVGAA